MDPLWMRQPTLPFTWVGASQLSTSGALEFGISPILISLFCNLKNHGIIGSALSGRRFLIINLIKQENLLFVGYPMIF
jgi:hypothetical protein